MYLFLFLYFMLPTITLFQQLQPEKKRSQKNFISHLTLVNQKEISLPRYKSDKMKVSEMNKLKLSYFRSFFFISMRNINIFFYFIRMIVTMKSGIRSFEYYITEGHMLYIFPYICIQKHFSSCPSQIVNINAKRVTFKLQSYKVKIWPNCLKRLCWLHPLEEYFLEKDMQPP